MNKVKPTFALACALAIHPAYAERVVMGEMPPTAGFYDDDGDVDEAPYERCGSVAIVRICGPLLQRGGWYWDGHEAIKSRMLAALADPRVLRIALWVDSPGGVVADCFESVRAVGVAALAAGKPIVGYASGNGAYSAGYCWLSVCERVYLSDAAGLGSIGVLMAMYDRTAATKEMGLRMVIVRSGSQKAEGHPDVAITDESLGRAQAEVDYLAGLFAAIVGDARSMTADAVLELQAGCFRGQAAVDAGLANGVLSPEAFLALVEDESRKDSNMSVAEKLGLPAGASEQQIEAAVEALKTSATTLRTSNESLEVRLVKGAKLVAAYVGLQLAVALRERRISAGEAGTDAEPGPLRKLGAQDPDLLAESLSGRAEGSAVPSPLTQPEGAPARAGATKSSPEPTEFPATTAEQAALYGRNPNLYHALRAKRDGAASSAPLTVTEG